MKVRHVLIAAASLGMFASASFATELYHPSNAEEGVSFQPAHLSTALTRAQVHATVVAAQGDGTLTWISRGYPPRYPHTAGPASSTTRAQVLDELRLWKARPVTTDGMRQVQGELGWVDARQLP